MKYSVKCNKTAMQLLNSSGIVAFVILLIGVFLDFDKKDDTQKLEIINCNMSSSTFKGSFVPGKSFSQQTIETKANPPSASFSQQNTQQKPVVTQQPQTTTPQSQPAPQPTKQNQ